MELGISLVRALKNGARALDGKFFRVELGAWTVALARGGEDWWLAAALTVPGTAPTPTDWYSLGWLVAALGAPPASREPTWDTAKPFTWEWPAAGG